MQNWPTVQVRDKETFPTPTKHNAQETGCPSDLRRNTPALGAIMGGQLNPTWVEKLMGWPKNWTSLTEKPSMNTWSNWGDDWEEDIPRVTTETTHRADRLKAIGNGQVPVCMATAFRLLSSGWLGEI